MSGIADVAHRSFIMKQFPKYALMLVALMTAGPTAFAQSRATPLERARQIASLTAGGPHDPVPAIPASDVVTFQLNAQLNAPLGGAGPYAGNR